MKFLLDVNVLISSIWTENSRFTQASAWLRGKQIVVCPEWQLVKAQGICGSGFDGEFPTSHDDDS